MNIVPVGKFIYLVFKNNNDIVGITKTEHDTTNNV